MNQGNSYFDINRDGIIDHLHTPASGYKVDKNAIQMLQETILKEIPITAQPIFWKKIETKNKFAKLWHTMVYQREKSYLFQLHCVMKM